MASIHPYKAGGLPLPISQARSPCNHADVYFYECFLRNVSDSIRDGNVTEVYLQRRNVLTQVIHPEKMSLNKAKFAVTFL